MLNFKTLGKYELLNSRREGRREWVGERKYELKKVFSISELIAYFFIILSTRYTVIKIKHVCRNVFKNDCSSYFGEQDYIYRIVPL